MLLRSLARERRGAVLPLFALLVVLMFCFVALAIDVGVMTLARTQCQNAADASATSAARALNGDGTLDNNRPNAQTQFATTATKNNVLGTAITAGNVTGKIGTYGYDPTYNTYGGFRPDYPVGAAGTNWTLANATVQSGSRNFFFAPVFDLLPSGGGPQFHTFSTQAVATAVHRPRDICIIIDFSGSMGGDTSWGTGNFGDPVVPAFGGYSAPGVNSSLVNGGASRDNISRDTSFGTKMIDDIWAHSAAPDPVTGTRAFTPAASTTDPAISGDNPPRMFSSSAYAKTTADVCNTADPVMCATILPTKAPYNSFQGYTEGPGYWGKTFFMWPPSPVAAKDWRQKFFGVNDSSKLWDAGGNWLLPRVGVTTNYTINYTAILDWIKNTGPTQFPTQMRSGRIQFYDAIPSSINIGTAFNYNPGSYTSWETLSGTDRDNLNQRFWMEYIHYVLQVKLNDSAGTNWSVANPLLLHGGDFTWGTPQITSGNTVNTTDNPKRPKLHFWFGPLSMFDFISRGKTLGASPAYTGVMHQCHMWPCKVGILGGLDDIAANHPNDFVTTAWFSNPVAQNRTDGRFNRIRAPLGRNYVRAKGALWYPPGALTDAANVTVSDQTQWSNVSTYDRGSLTESPWANGNTCYSMPLMLAFNQFSTNALLPDYSTSQGPNSLAGAPKGESGGFGRRGAQKLVILETDGAPNTLATASPVISGTPQQSYYPIRAGKTGTPANELPISGSYIGDNASSVLTEIFAVANQLCADETAGGYSVARKPVYIHTVGFGNLSGAEQSTLQKVQHIGNTQPDDTTPLPAYKLINQATYPAQITALQTAFTQILQDGIQISLIE